MCSSNAVRATLEKKTVMLLYKKVAVMFITPSMYEILMLCHHSYPTFYRSFKYVCYDYTRHDQSYPHVTRGSN